MKWMRKSMLALAVVAVVSSVVVYALFFHGHDTGKRMYIDSVILVFQGVRGSIETDLRNSNEIDPDSLYKKWDQVAKGSLREVSKVFFGRAGEIAVVSERFGIVIVILPTVDSSHVHGWHCSTYPRVSFDTLCSTI